jgi:hypothetical protein
MEPIELGQLKHRYYQPGLLPILLGYSNEKLREVPAFDFVRLFPSTALKIDKDQLVINLKNRGGGFGKVSVFADNIELISDARASVSDSSGNALTLTVDLTRFNKYFRTDTTNVIKVVAWNAEGYLSGSPDTIHYTPVTKEARGVGIASKKQTPAPPPALWGIVVGTSDYAGDQIDLKFAAKDAADFSQAVVAGARRLFGAGRVNMELISTDRKEPGKQPTKKNILQAFEAAGASAPGDIAVIYFSGHGVNHGGQDGDFYYLTMDATSAGNEHLNDKTFRDNFTISSAELTMLINRIPARKKVLILDACAAGKAADVMLTAMREVPSSQIRALDRMQDRTGFYILAGSASDAVSYETSLYGQGLLTYSLLKAMRGAQLRKEGTEEYIDVVPLLQYAVEEVPRLAKGIGGIQQPFYKCPDNNRSFDIGRMEATDKTGIIISEPKPIFTSTTFQDEDELYDKLALSEKVNSLLVEINARGKDAEFCYTEGKGYPGACQLSGTYSVNDTVVTLNYIIRKGNRKLGEKNTLTGSTRDLQQFIEALLAQIRSRTADLNPVNDQ